MKWYLAGPIQGVENKQCYRDELKTLLKTMGDDYYDPWEDEAVFYESFDYKTACYLSKKDKEKVRECDGIIVYFLMCSIGANAKLSGHYKQIKKLL